MRRISDMAALMATHNTGLDAEASFATLTLEITPRGDRHETGSSSMIQSSIAPPGPVLASGKLAVVIPALNEAARIGGTIAVAKSRLGNVEIIVVDGGSTDATKELAARAGAVVVTSPRGRGVQCRAGADAASEAWLLFLHADTLLPENAADVVERFMENSASQIATFRLRFDGGGWFLRTCGWFTRFDSVFTRFGDQGILIRRSFYDALGGFSAWPLFEDVDLLQRARSKAKIRSLHAYVTTSARRFRHRGVVRQQWLNARLLVRYLLGTPPEKLAAIYRADQVAP